MDDDNNVVDFRQVIEEKLRLKRDALVETETTLKKYAVVMRENRFPAAGGGVAGVRGRLGPRPSLEARLGPKIHEEVREEIDPKNVASRIVVSENTKSRDAALAEEELKMDKREKQRNRRMFGQLLGTLQKFRQDENRVKERELKKREVEKKIEEKTEQEKIDAKRTKHELFSEKKRQQHEIKVLQVQMERIREFEVWEASKRRELNHIRTAAAPHIFFMPNDLDDRTRSALEASRSAVDAEIRAGRAAFEEDLLRIEAKISDASVRGHDYTVGADNDADNDDSTAAVKSVASQVLKRPSSARRDRNGAGRRNGERQGGRASAKRERSDPAPAGRDGDADDKEKAHKNGAKAHARRPEPKRARVKKAEPSDSSESDSSDSDSTDSDSTDSHSDSSDSDSSSDSDGPGRGAKEIKLNIKKEIKKERMGPTE